MLRFLLVFAVSHAVIRTLLSSFSNEASQSRILVVGSG